MPLHSNIRDFSDLGMRVEEFCIRKHNEFLLSLWRDLISENPVDTGASRSNWHLTPGQVSRAKTNPRDGTQYPPPAEPDVWQYTYRWKKWYFANYSEYIGALNEGSSKQAPAGWIDAAIQRNIAKFSSGFTRTS